MSGRLIVSFSRSTSPSLNRTKYKLIFEKSNLRLNFLLVLQQQVFGKIVLFPDYVSYFFVYFPVGFITVWLLERLFASH